MKLWEKYMLSKTGLKDTYEKSGSPGKYSMGKAVIFLKVLSTPKRSKSSHSIKMCRAFTRYLNSLNLGFLE